MLDKLWDSSTELRLIGISVTSFNQLKSQTGLFDSFQLNEKWRDLETAMDKVRRKYGFLSIMPVSVFKIRGQYPSSARGFHLNSKNGRTVKDDS